MSAETGITYAEVSVNSPVARNRSFSYTVPPGMNIRVGQAVLVPFGERTLQGIVIELTDVPAVEETREIISILSVESVVSEHHLKLARWISAYYLSPLFDAISLMLPPGFERSTIVDLSLVTTHQETGSLNETERLILESVTGGITGYHELERKIGKKKTAAAVSRLVRRGILTRTYRLAPPKVKPKKALFVSAVDGVEVPELTPRQNSLYNFIKNSSGISWEEARLATGTDKSVLTALETKGLITITEREITRDPLAGYRVIRSQPFTLTPYQQNAVALISHALQHPENKPDAFLLRGVTGSGKTEVYLQALAECIRLGKKGLFLVPEIAMTPQTIERLAARFPDKVAVLHSGLNLGEQYDEWRRIQAGEFDVVIGSRSALFSPQPDPGLIILDEEHEWTYKQDSTPRYHARDTALKLAQLTGAVVVLGSATPDVGSYFKADSGEYRLIELPERITVAGGRLPFVEIVDMRDELKAGNLSIFSRQLTQEINRVLAAGEQIILFLNRRGGATFIQCRRCGFVLRCKRCEIPLCHHISGDILMCHQCGATMMHPTACPQCGYNQLKYLGTGTQKLEHEVKFTFPRARLLRWDRDTASGRFSHEKILEKLKNGEVDILIGTQMIAKGLDLPAVTLVGVMNADTALNLPDFRAGERTFQLLSQVAGRAGRGPGGGRVIIQTFTPEHFAIRAAAAHDYGLFYGQELEYRRVLRNPPFTHLARLMFSHSNDEICRRNAVELKTMLTGEIERYGLAGIEIIGPAPVFIHRLRGRYRWHIILRGTGLSEFLGGIDLPRGWVIDIDPVNLLQ